MIRQHFDPSVEVVHDAAAAQYRESLRAVLPSAAIQHAEHAAAQWGGFRMTGKGRSPIVRATATSDRHRGQSVTHFRTSGPRQQQSPGQARFQPPRALSLLNCAWNCENCPASSDLRPSHIRFRRRAGCGWRSAWGQAGHHAVEHVHALPGVHDRLRLASFSHRPCSEIA